MGQARGWGGVGGVLGVLVVREGAVVSRCAWIGRGARVGWGRWWMGMRLWDEGGAGAWVGLGKCGVKPAGGLG
ncbi:hypothetical protein Aglo03_21370 [Actinokineospora globicatena]|uniref:Uncharacterized protein n=1 Tax=Actinokineospora globicatena TaxID=103729 RepID=A0A9W6QHS6_9PSEU|nr:hypothetical protein Aglo03_21370 [Actinokineospora globicatena]